MSKSHRSEQGEIIANNTNKPLCLQLAQIWKLQSNKTYKTIVRIFHTNSTTTVSSINKSDSLLAMCSTTNATNNHLTSSVQDNLDKPVYPG